MQIQVFGFTDPGDRTENEDSFAIEQINDNCIYAIVCGGLGSGPASRLCVNFLSQFRIQSEFPSADRIRSQLEQANAQLLAQSENAHPMKTTAAALFVNDGRAVWAHIGSTRLYHFHDGCPVDFSEDHSAAQLAVMKGEITRRDIPSHPDRHRLTRVMGEASVNPEVHPEVVLAPGLHAFLLCSDGLWERLQEDEILLDLHKSASPEQWIYHLRVRALMRRWTEVDSSTAAAVFIRV